MTFTKEELERFATEYDHFAQRCDYALAILRKYHYKCDVFDYECIDNWSIDSCGLIVVGVGLDGSCGKYQYVCFPSDFLTKTDEELISIVEAEEKERIRKRKEEEEKKRLKEEKETRQKELAELKRLKEKYESGMGSKMDRGLMNATTATVISNKETGTCI